LHFLNFFPVDINKDDDDDDDDDNDKSLREVVIKLKLRLQLRLIDDDDVLVGVTSKALAKYRLLDRNDVVTRNRAIDNIITFDGWMIHYSLLQVTTSKVTRLYFLFSETTVQILYSL